MSERRGHKRPKSFYKKSHYKKRQKLNSLSPGMKGFLVTCNNDEKQAVRESYNILNEYADILYGPEKIGEKETADSDNASEEEDMEKAIAAEVKAIKESSSERRFQNTDTSAKNCIFIRTSLDNPSELHHKIFSDLYEKKLSKARFAQRMLPVLGTCKATVGDVKTLAECVLPKYFSSAIGEDKSYSIVLKVRNNNGIGRESLYPVFGEIIKSLNPLNKVNCDNPDITIIVDIVCTICCLGVCTDFFKFRKYNFHEIARDKPVAKKENIQEATKTDDDVADVANKKELGAKNGEDVVEDDKTKESNVDRTDSAKDDDKHNGIVEDSVSDVKFENVEKDISDETLRPKNEADEAQEHGVKSTT